MKKEEFDKFIIDMMVTHYGYNIIEVHSKDGRKSFWGIEKGMNGEKECLVFLSKDNIKNVDVQENEDLIRVLVLSKENDMEEIRLDEREIHKVLIVDKFKNKIIYCPERLQNIGREIHSILLYKEKIENERKEEKKSIITWGLISVNIFLYIVTAILSKNIVDSDIRVLIFLGAKVNELINSGEYYRFITAMFLHGGIMHLALNMYALKSLGVFIEKVYGKVKYLIIYFGAGIVSFLFSYMFSEGVSIGASGAIFGLLGAALTFSLKRKDRVGKEMVKNIISVIGINIFIGITIPNIDNFGHIGGLIGGALVTLLLRDKNG